LPGAEAQSAAGDRDAGGMTAEGGFDVGDGVFSVVAVVGGGDHAGEGRGDVCGDLGVLAFLDEHAGGAVRDVDAGDAVARAGGGWGR